jgi:Amt family ammonium transporter
MEDAAAAAGGQWTMLNQLGVQVTAVLIALVYAAVVTFIILFLVNKLTGLRSSPVGEMAGLDNTYHGERGYDMLNPN